MESFGFLAHPLLGDLRLPHGFATAGAAAAFFAHDDPRKLEQAKRSDLDACLDRALGHVGDAAQRVLTVRQTHSPYILEIHRADSVVPAAESVRCDALVTDRPGLLVAVKTADCLPILLAEPDRGVVAAVHAGWRGTYRGILHHSIQRMVSAFGCSPDAIRLVFGPCARACCYEVDSELGESFAERFGPGVVRRATPRPFLDLVAVNRWQAGRLGVAEAHMGDMNACTICSESPRFYSWRRDRGRTGRLVNMIGLPAGAEHGAN